MPPPDHGADDEAGGGFLSRWSRRKALVRQGVPLAEPEPPVPAPQPSAALARPAAPGDALAAPHQPAAPAVDEPTAALAEAAPAPTLAEVASLTQDSDFTRFVAPGVDSGVKNAALKKLFTAPHFNVMDGLDTYIDDYGQPDPLPEGMLRQMAQSHALGLFADDPPEPAPPPALRADMRADAVLAQAVEPVHAADPETQPDTELLQDCTLDENADLRLQPHDAAGPAGPGQSPGQAAGGEHRRD